MGQTLEDHADNTGRSHLFRAAAAPESTGGNRSTRRLGQTLNAIPGFAESSLDPDEQQLRGLRPITPFYL